MSWLLVACGGAIGASLRYGIGLLFGSQQGFPWATWTINIFGCFCAGVFFALSQKYPVLQQQTRLFFMVGILGGFTTFSSFGLETFQLLKQQQLGLAFCYMASSVVCGVIMLALGYLLLQKI